MARGRAVIVDDGKVALIERRKAGKLYYVFPGGGADPRETTREAARREVFEELGLNVEIGDLLAEDIYEGESNVFYLAKVVDGSFGNGLGEEMTASEDSEWGSYRPLWVPLDQISKLMVLPEAVARLL